MIKNHILTFINVSYYVWLSFIHFIFITKDKSYFNIKGSIWYNKGQLVNEDLRRRDGETKKIRNA